MTPKFGPPVLGDDEPGEEPQHVIVAKDGKDHWLMYREALKAGMRGTFSILDGTGKQVLTVSIPTKRMPAVDPIDAVCFTIDQVMNDVARAFAEDVTAEEFVEAARRAAGLIEQK